MIVTKNAYLCASKYYTKLYMKKIILAFLFVLSYVTCWGQDVVTYKTGQSFKAIITEVTETVVKYRIPGTSDDAATFDIPVSEIASIVYSNGVKDVFGETGVLRMNTYSGQSSEMSEQTVLRVRVGTLNVWSKILKIYGWVNIGAGIICIACGSKNYEPTSGDTYNSDYLKTVGIGGVLEGGLALTIGCKLQQRRRQLIEENNLVGSIPVIEHEFQFEHCTLAPSVNLMSYRNNYAEGVGAGLSIKF